MRVVTLELALRPPTMNGYRTLHHYKRAAVDKEWREAFAYLALSEKPRPRFDRIGVTASPICRSGTTLPDVGACFPVVKAAIDGLVDAGVIPNDTGAHLRALTFVPPVHGERDSLVLTIEELS